MAAYWRAKRALFAWPGLQAAVLNVDDAQGASWPTSCAAAPLDLWTCSMRGAGAAARAATCATTTAAWPSRCTKASSSVPVRSALIGDFNASQPAAGASAALRALGRAAGRRGARGARR